MLAYRPGIPSVYDHSVAYLKALDTEEIDFFMIALLSIFGVTITDRYCHCQRVLTSSPEKYLKAKGQLLQEPANDNV
jgi:hypothetical protein